MAVLNREEFFNKIQSVVGENTDENSISFIEDMTDTFNSLEQKSEGDGIDWKQRYDELDATWREKYRHRFFSSNGQAALPDVPAAEPEQKAITIDDLFE